MRYIPKYTVIISLIFLIGCNREKKNPDNYQNQVYEESDFQVEEESETSTYSDGTYSATVEYYNPETGFSNTYTLDVEVEDNMVTVIYFNNGGYLDDDHIIPEELDEDGYAFISGDDGKTYSVQIDD